MGVPSLNKALADVSAGAARAVQIAEGGSGSHQESGESSNHASGGEGVGGGISTLAMAASDSFAALRQSSAGRGGISLRGPTLAISPASILFSSPPRPLTVGGGGLTLPGWTSPRAYASTSAASRSVYTLGSLTPFAPRGLLALDVAATPGGADGIGIGIGIGIDIGIGSGNISGTATANAGAGGGGGSLRRTGATSAFTPANFAAHFAGATAGSPGESDPVARLKLPNSPLLPAPMMELEVVAAVAGAPTPGVSPAATQVLNATQLAPIT